MQEVGVLPVWTAYGASFEDNGLLFQRVFGDPPPGTTVKRERSGNLNFCNPRPSAHQRHGAARVAFDEEVRDRLMKRVAPIEQRDDDARINQDGTLHAPPYGCICDD